MWKRVLVFLLIVTLSGLVFGGCGKKGPPVAPPEAEEDVEDFKRFPTRR